MVDSVGTVGAMGKRRAPEPVERRRDAERTRHALLDAAQEEFAVKGRSGARVSAIAERAGVNKQLISYYFGGKDGLYDALLERWLAQEAELTRDELPLGELACRYLELGLGGEASLHRLFIRESLDEDVSDATFDPEAPEVADIRARQERGEIRDDLDPAFLLLMLQGMVVGHLVFRRDAVRFTGLDPCSPAYLEAAKAELRKVVQHLGAPDGRRRRSRTS